MVSLRLFVAFATPSPVKERLLEIIGRLRAASADVSWERAEKMHCTLKFLGGTPEDRLPRISRLLRGEAEAHSPFRVRYTGLGCFPDAGRPRTLWAGIEDEEGLLSGLQRGVEGAMAEAGFAAENRPFRPHVTLGRVKSPRNSRKLIEILETLTLSTDTFPVADIRLMSSETRPAGSEYAVREVFSLVGNRPHGE